MAAPKKKSARRAWKSSDPKAFKRLDAEVERRRLKQERDLKERGIEPTVAVHEQGLPGGVQTIGTLLRPFMQKHGVPDSALTEEPKFDPEEERRRAIQDARDFRAKKWETICPTRFLNSFSGELCPAPQESVSAVLNWEPGPRGLWIIGETGRSKSWTLWTMLRRLYVEQGLTVMVLDGIQFANEAAAAWGNSGDAEAWLRRLVKPQVLVIDDFGKRFTPAAQQAAFAVIDRRLSRNRPFMATTNYTGERIAKMCADVDLSDPLRRRLREGCEVVVF